eukprot:403352746
MNNRVSIHNSCNQSYWYFMFGIYIYNLQGRDRGGDRDSQKRTRESAIDLAPLVDKKLRIKFVGGREVTGILKGADPTSNLVLDDAIEYIRDAKDPYNITEQTRELGFLVARGTTILSIATEEGAFINIENPYAVTE